MTMLFAAVHESGIGHLADMQIAEWNVSFWGADVSHGCFISTRPS